MPWEEGEMKSTGHLATCVLCAILLVLVSWGQSPATDVHALATENVEGAACDAAGLPAMACDGVSTNQEWTPLVREFDVVEMVLVPAGCFSMGNEIGFYVQR